MPLGSWPHVCDVVDVVPEPYCIDVDIKYDPDATTLMYPKLGDCVKAEPTVVAVGEYVGVGRFTMDPPVTGAVVGVGLGVYWKKLVEESAVTEKWFAMVLLAAPKYTVAPPNSGTI